MEDFQYLHFHFCPKKINKNHRNILNKIFIGKNEIAILAIELKYSKKDDNNEKRDYSYFNKFLNKYTEIETKKIMINQLTKI